MMAAPRRFACAQFGASELGKRTISDSRLGAGLPPRSLHNRGVTTPSDRCRILRRWDRSGLCARDFAPVAGVSASTLYVWRSRERRPAPAFVELSAPPEAASPATPIEVALPRGLAVRVPPGFDPDTLRRVVDALLA